MAAPIAAIAKVAAAVLSDERGRKAVGWIVVAILAPVILLVAAFCSILGGSADHNNSVLQLCFSGGALPANMPAEYRVYVEDMQHSFALLDGYMETVNNMTEGETGLDAIRVKAIFYALYFGDEAPSSRAHQQFVDCFVTYEERTRTVTTTDKEGNEVETEESYTVAIPITDLETVWANVQAATGLTVTEEHRSNADSIYNLVRYGSSTGTEDWIPGAEAPFIGADGFCSPIGSGWESRVTSEFGYRRDPFTGETRGHCGSPRRGHHRHLQRRRLRLLCDDRPRQRHGDPVRPLLQTGGQGGQHRAGRRHCVPVRLYRTLHRTPSALRGAHQRPACQSKSLFTHKLKETF